MSSNIKIAITSLGVLSGITILSGLALANPNLHAEQTCTTVGGVTTCSDYGTPPVTVVNSATASVTVSAACSLSATGTTHTGTPTPGQFTGNIGTSNVTATCNNAGGYAIFAVGYYNNAVSTNLTGSSGNIATDPNSGHATSGNTSYWYMKLAQGTGDAATIISPYNDYHTVPSSYTKVATCNSATSGTGGTSFTTTYGTYIAPTQASGTYNGGVKYTLVNPSSASAPTT